VSLHLLFDALAEWVAPLGRPVSFRDDLDYEELPVIQIGTWGHSDPCVDTLDGPVARKVGITFTSIGRNLVDTQALDNALMDLFSAGLPAGLAVEIVSLVAETGAALEPTEGRMLAVHRVALAYR
jgi:hypothetical protein